MRHRVIAIVGAVAVLVALVSFGAAPAVAQSAAVRTAWMNRTYAVFGISAPLHRWSGRMIWQTKRS